MNALDKNTTSTEIVLNQKNIELGHDLGDWFIFRETRHFGPLTTKQVNQYLLSRLISTNHHIWRPGFESWLSIKSIESFRAFGHPEIDFITDNDFSFQAQLGPIDRIKFQENEISFQENAGLKILQINVKNEVSEKLDTIKTKLAGLYNSALTGLGVKEEQRYLYNLGLSSVFIIGFMALSAIIFNSNGEDSFVNKLPKEIRNKIYANAKIPETTKNPSLVIFEKDTKLKDPVFVGSINLPLGSKIKIDVKGISKTLVGSYRFSKSMELTLHSQFFQTEPIRGVSGQYLSPGKYTVEVTCLSCDKENYLITKSEYSFGIQNIESYSKDLKDFHLKSRESANLELEELSELSDTLQDQYQGSMSIYNRSINLKSISAWNKYSAGWLSNQKKIVDLFEQIQSEEFKSKLYYLSLYEAYGDLMRMIFELHILQDKYLSGKEKNLNLAGKILDMSQGIKLKSSYLKSQTELMILNFNKSKGLPSKDGLNLNNIL
jgi:hypothetical protein